MSTVEFVNKKVKCRKQHKCTWCGERLQEGDDAFFRKKIHDGYFLSEHFHIACHDAMAKLKMEQLEQELKQFTLKVDGKSFSCKCGCNVFRKPDENNPDFYECNACRAWYESEG